MVSLSIRRFPRVLAVPFPFQNACRKSKLPNKKHLEKYLYKVIAFIIRASCIFTSPFRRAAKVCIFLSENMH